MYISRRIHAPSSFKYTQVERNLDINDPPKLLQEIRNSYSKYHRRRIIGSIIQSNNLAAIRYLFSNDFGNAVGDKNNVDVSYLSQYAFRSAIAFQKIDIIKYLVTERIYDIIAHNDSVINRAASVATPEIMTYLLEMGVNPNIESSMPLRIACRFNVDVVPVLTQFTVDIHAHTEDALMQAIQSKCVATVNCLIEAGADINANQGEPLREAIRSNYEAVRVLIDAGADTRFINARDMRYLISCGSKDMILYLSSKHVDFTLINDSVQSSTKATELIDTLIDLGVDIHVLSMILAHALIG